MTTVPTELDTRFRDAAAGGGLLDIAYDMVDSPIGPLLVAVSDHGLCRISFENDPEGHLDALARRHGPRVLRTTKPVDRVRRQLDEYFDGTRQEFEVETDLRTLAPFNREVLSELSRVGYGELTTYGTLAARVGRPTAARAVGTVMHRNPIPIILPCHRVVGSTGKLVGYAGGLDVKERLLRLEGAIV